MSTIPERPFDYHRSRARERSLGFFATIILIFLCLLAGIIVAIYFAPHPELIFGEKDDGNSAIYRSVTVGDTLIEIPTDKVARLGNDDIAKGAFAEVVAPWPEIGSSVSERPAGLSDFSDHFIIRFEPVQPGLSQDELFANIYPVYVAGPPHPTSFGLEKYTFRTESPYAPISLYSAEIDGKRIYIHCDKGNAGSNNPTLCERIGRLSDKTQVRVQFAEQFLNAWQAIHERSQTIIKDYTGG